MTDPDEPGLVRGDAALWQSYLATIVGLTLPDGSGLVIRPAPRGVTGRWPWPHDVAWILTACNPGGPLPDEENAQRHSALGAWLDAEGIVHCEAIGYEADDPSWSEPGYCLPGAGEDVVMAIARHWGQAAVFRWTREEWSCVGAHYEGRTTIGWTTDPAG